jgi:hypothetical protein
MTRITEINGIYQWSPSGEVLHTEDDAPFIIGNGTKMWFCNGKRHRVSGPAVENSTYCEFWIDGVRYKEDDFKIVAFSVYGQGVNC